MICEMCSRGVHRMCEGKDCQCSRRVSDKQADVIVTQGNRDRAERVYQTLMHTQSYTAQLITQHSGPQNAIEFIRMVLQAEKMVV